MAKVTIPDVSGELIRWSQRMEWQGYLDKALAEYLDPYCDELNCTLEDLPDKLGQQVFGLVFGAVFEDFAVTVFEEECLALTYLKRRRFKIAAPARTYLEALAASQLSLCEVLEVEPRKRVRVRDLLGGGEPQWVNERSGTKHLYVWDLIVCRVLPLRPATTFSGVLLKVDRDSLPEMLEQFQSGVTAVLKGFDDDAEMAALSDAADREQLARLFVVDQMTHILIELGIEYLVEGTLSPSLPPEIVNRDGESLILCRAAYPITGKIAEVARRLDAQESLDRGNETDPRWEWIPLEDALEEEVDEDSEVDEIDFRLEIGEISIEAGTLYAVTNSSERNGRLRAFLEPVLSGCLGVPEIDEKTIRELLEKAAEAEPPPPTTPAEDLAATAEMIAAHQDHHYRDTLDQPVPMLEGKTPRQAVRSKAGRQKAASWLKYLENKTDQDCRERDLPGYDFTWMWEALKIGHLR